MGEKQDWVPLEVKRELDDLMVEYGYQSLGDKISLTELDEELSGRTDFR